MAPGAGAGTGVDVGARAARSRGADAGQNGTQGPGRSRPCVLISGHQLAPGYWPPARPPGSLPGRPGWHRGPGPGTGGQGQEGGDPHLDQELTSGCRPVLVRSGPRHQDRGPETPDDSGAPPPSPRGAAGPAVAGTGPARVPRTGALGGTARHYPSAPPRVPGTGGTGPKVVGSNLTGPESPGPEARELPGGAGTGATGTRHGYRQASTGATREPGREPGTGARTKRLAPLDPLARCRYPLWTWRPPLVVRQENHDLAVSPVDLASAGTLGTSGQLTLRSDPPSWSAWRDGPRDGPRGGPRATSWFGSRGQAGPPGRSSGRSPD